jgi:hypothetical protein
VWAFGAWLSRHFDAGELGIKRWHEVTNVSRLCGSYVMFFLSFVNACVFGE